MTNTRIKVLSAIGFFLIGAFFYTQFQKSQIKQATATVAKLSATQTLINNSGTITKVIANDNQLPDNSQQKATVNALFNAGYVSDKQVQHKQKSGMYQIINCNLANKKTAYYFLVP